MKPLSEQPTTALQAHLAAVLSALSQKEPHLTRELQFILQAMATREDAPEFRYAGLTAPRDLIPLVLTLHQRWMTKQEILDALLAGGYILPPKGGKGLLNDAFRYLLETHAIIGYEGESTWQHVIGLPHWAKPKHAKGKAKLLFKENP